MDYGKLKQNVHDRISEYLGFDLNKLKYVFPGDWTIYGGAVRDAIANRQIHDVDILCKPKACRRLHDILLSNGFEEVEPLEDIMSAYEDIDLIFFPITFKKDDTYIQLIRPRTAYLHPGTPETRRMDIMNPPPNIYANYEKLISDVDIRCCGVSYDLHSVHEQIPGAIDDCLKSELVVMPNARMKTDRLKDRIAKLVDRGWKVKDDETPDSSSNEHINLFD